MVKLCSRFLNELCFTQNSFVLGAKSFKLLADFLSKTDCKASLFFFCVRTGSQRFDDKRISFIVFHFFVERVAGISKGVWTGARDEGERLIMTLPKV